MTTFAQARAELVTAMAGVGNGATSQPGALVPPYVFVRGDGAESDHIARGVADSAWIAVLIAGGWDAKGSADALDVLKTAALTALRDLAGWTVESLGRDGMRTYGGSELLTAELRGIRQVDV